MNGRGQVNQFTKQEKRRYDAFEFIVCIQNIQNLIRKLIEMVS